MRTPWRQRGSFIFQAIVTRVATALADFTNFYKNKLDNIKAGAVRREHILLQVGDETTDLTTGVAKLTFDIPYGFTLEDIIGTVNTAPTGRSIVVDVNDDGTSIMTTNKLEIDVSDTSTKTAATPPLLTSTLIAANSRVTVDIDFIGSGVAGDGLKVYLVGYQT